MREAYPTTNIEQKRLAQSRHLGLQTQSNQRVYCCKTMQYRCSSSGSCSSSSSSITRVVGAAELQVRLVALLLLGLLGNGRRQTERN